MADTAGQKLRKAILATYELDVGELVLLDQVTEICDRLDQVNRAVGLLVELTTLGSAGQEVEHPMLRTQRDYSALLARLVEALRLPVPGAGEDESGESSTTLAARRAARARWDKREDKRG